MADPVIDDVKDDGVDNITADHDAGIGSSADDLETHNPDMADFDEVLAGLENQDDDVDDASGGTKNTDDSADSGTDDSDTKDGDGKGGDDDEADIPRKRLNEVIGQRDDERKLRHEDEVKWAGEKAMLEGRLAALEEGTKKPEEVVVDPFDEILKGEPQAILDAFTENPTTFVRSIQAQAKAQAAAEIKLQRDEERYQVDLGTAMDKFAGEHEDFMPNADKLMRIIDGSPIHNAISAYAYEIEIPALTVKLEEATKGVDEKIAAAKTEGIAEGKKQAIKEFQAKGASVVLDGGSQANQGGQANAGAELETGGDGVKLREKLTADLLKKRAAAGN